MAEHTLETRILLRYDSYSNWMNSSVILKVGEAAVAAFPNSNTIVTSNNKPEHTPPAIGIKIGDGEHYFYQLPWVQGIAADVYSWAKSSIKPTYSAQEIQGLQSFVENLVGDDVSVNIAPRIYSLVKGTGDNINKYYLQYKENDENSNWILDTSSYIDLSNLAELINWIGEDLTEYDSIADRTEQHIQYDLGRLKVPDSEVSKYFVTSVAQEKGKISTTKRLLSFNDIDEILPVSKGGTGRNTLTADSVLVGNGTDQVQFIPIAESIANNNHLVPNNLIKAYVDNATAGLSGAMHFIGEATVVINNNSHVDPQIPNYEFSSALPGDVILSNAKEFVWTGSNWHLLGDESSYAIKGNIRDADIHPDAEIEQSKIAGLSNTFNTKVDKVEGKSLTSNDFTDELKQKLEDIGVNAETNIIEHIMLNGIEIPPQTIEQVSKVVNLEIQEFDDNAQAKLAGIEAEAQVNKVESIIINGSEYTPNEEKKIEIQIDQAALNLNVLEGARVPSLTSGQFEDIDITTNPKKLDLSRVSKTGLISDLLQTQNTYMILNCGSSTTVV